MVPIPGYPEYFIDEHGNVFSKHVNRLLKIAVPSNGYPMIRLSKDGISKNIRLHRLLAFVFLDLDSLDSPMEVHHKNGDILDYSLGNLEVLSSHAHRIITNGREPKYCVDCNKLLTRDNQSGKCRPCIEKSNPITADLIHYWVVKHSWSRASRELGMSDVGLRKRFERLTGLPAKNIKDYAEVA